MFDFFTKRNSEYNLLKLRFFQDGIAKWPEAFDGKSIKIKNNDRLISRDLWTISFEVKKIDQETFIMERYTFHFTRLSNVWCKL